METIENNQIEEVKDKKLTKEELVEKAKKLNLIHTSWKDYALFLLNTADEESRENWRQKFITSMIHWNFNTGSISESNIIGLEVMSSLPSEFTLEVTDDAWNREEWYRDKRLAGSKRQVVCLGHYPQESISNEANIALKAILNSWDENHYMLFDNDYISRMWDFAQKSNGNIITQDEVLTYTLDKATDEKVPAYWVDVADDIFTNGVDDFKYKKEYRSGKLEGYPFAEGSGLEWKSTDEEGRQLTLEEMKQNFINMIDVILKEDINYSPAYKKLAITILKNDKVGQYMGFQQTLKERRARQEAMMAFSTQEKEKNRAINEMKKIEILEEKSKK